MANTDLLERAKEIVSEIEAKEKSLESTKTELIQNETLFGEIKKRLKNEYQINDSKELAARIAEKEEEIKSGIQEYEEAIKESESA